MKLFLTICSMLLAFSSLGFAADKPSKQLLSIIDDDTEFTVNTPKGPVIITRVMTPCAKNAGWLQPMVPVAGVHTVGEIEILHALNDPDAMVVDMRRHEDRIKGTIPGSISIPYTEATKQMEQYGCKKNGTSYDCTAAKKIYGFCNGPVCPQSPLAITAMVKKGFPPEKIYYYRGGMLDWDALGLTVEVAKP